MYLAGLPLLLIKINRALTPYNFLLFATFHDLEVTLAMKHSVLKVNSIQEACAKYFVVHILNFKILQMKQHIRKFKNY